MTEQTKAEAYVRSQRPALYIPEDLMYARFRRMITKDCDDFQSKWKSPNLQDWLAVWEGKVRLDHTIGDTITVYDGKDNVIDFNLTTGQPNSPEDYKAFNDITSV